MRMGQNHGMLEKMIRHSLDIICTIDRNGHFIKVSDASKVILGYESEELEGRQFIDYVHPNDISRTLQRTQDVLNGIRITKFENRCIHKTGQEIPMLWSAVWSEEDEMIYCVGRDLTEQKLAEQKLHEKEELHQALVEHGSDMLVLLDKDLNYLYIGGSASRELGYQPELLIGRNAFNLIHPEDISMIRDSLSEVLSSGEPLKISDYRFKDSDGEWRWLETIVSNQFQNPAVKALVTSSRDITDRVRNRLKLQENKQRFKALFEANPDMVLFESREGILLDVNPAAVFYFGMEREEIINRPLSELLPPEVIPVCNESRQKAFKGEQVNFEMEISFGGSETRMFDVKKIPVMVNNEIVGVYIIAKDITVLTHSHNTIKQQARKLNTILESITDAFFTLDKDWKFTYINPEFSKLMEINVSEGIGKGIWEIFPEEINGPFYQQYHKAMETGKAVNFKSYNQKLGMWLGVKAYPSEEGLSVSFNDITARVKSKQELEKLSLVASKTINGVMILDAKGVIEWVNEGFTSITGYTFADAVGRQPREFLSGEETDPATLERLREKLKKGVPFSEEILNYKKSGEKVWLALDITPVFNEVGELTRFINIQTDITFRKEAEANQLELTLDLYRQNRDLQQFTYMVSHNLRGPVANAMGLTEMLTTLDKDSALFDESLAYLKSSVFQLDTVLKDLNMILSIREKKGTIDKERIQLLQVCQQAVNSLQDSLQSCGGEVIVKIEGDVWVRGNQAYLYSIFYQLLSNAIKFRSPKRSLRIDIKGFASTEKGAIISFSDNGCGFDMDKAGDHVFRLYKKFHAHSEGRGVGLFLVKTHLEAMDGRIEVSSQLNAGTKFLIYLK